MGKIVLDRAGDLRKGVFYRFNVQFNDDLTPDVPTPEWIVALRTPTDDELLNKGHSGYLYLEDLPKSKDRVETRDCPVDPTHVTHRYYKAVWADAYGRSHLSPFIPTLYGLFAITGELRSRIDLLTVKGARLDPIKIKVNQCERDVPQTWAIQFVGKAKRRLPRFVDAPNCCPYCGKTKIMCESCGDWMPYCNACERYMIDIRGEKDDDSALAVEENLWSVIEGNTWDGSDLIGGRWQPLASKRFIDWLLRIHAAPFYAEPVYLCVDGMNDQQKKWLDDLQKPFEA